LILNFIGDAVLADLFEKYKSGIGSRLLKGSFDPFSHFFEYFNHGDVNIINLESVLSDITSKKYPWSEIMRGNPDSIKLLNRNRIHVVNLANNHTLDHGLEAYYELTNNLDKAGIVHFGGPQCAFQISPSSLVFEGQKISFLGYYIEESLPPSERDELIERIIENVKRNKTDNAILILSLHWGSEYSDKPFSWMIDTGKRLIESGVDILYGHHSHTYQGVARYENGIFAPNLGNFVFEDIFMKNRRSVLLQVDFSKTELKHKTIPLLISKYGIPSPSMKAKIGIDRLNAQLEIVVGCKDQDYDLWDKQAVLQAKYGHLKNRLKIRSIVLAHPLKFLPFIFNR
jgi:gamma-polyglutamate biosynthesis protein CapA